MEERGEVAVDPFEVGDTPTQGGFAERLDRNLALLRAPQSKGGTRRQWVAEDQSTHVDAAETQAHVRLLLGSRQPRAHGARRTVEICPYDGVAGGERWFCEVHCALHASAGEGRNYDGQEEGEEPHA